MVSGFRFASFTAEGSRMIRGGGGGSGIGVSGFGVNDGNLRL